MQASEVPLRSTSKTITASALEMNYRAALLEGREILAKILENLQTNTKPNVRMASTRMEKTVGIGLASSLA